MKKITSILLILSVLFCLTACSGDKENNVSTGSSGNSGNSQTVNTNEESIPEGKSDNYTTYDELPYYEKIPFHEIYFSTPNWGSNKNMNGYVIKDSNDYAIIAAYNSKSAYDGDIDGINDFMKDGYIEVLYGFYVAEFSDIEYTDKNTVTLDCGAQALKFKGTLSGESGGSVSNLPIYGYTFAYDGATISITYVIKKADNASEYEATLTDIVDKMVKTIRTQP